MRRPRPDASDAEIAAFAREWVSFAAATGFELALAGLDLNERVAWTQKLFDELTFNHFDDGKQPRITDPRKVDGLRVEVYRYNDGTGFCVDHDLPLDDKRSDFTVQFEFRLTPTGVRVVLADVHVL